MLPSADNGATYFTQLRSLLEDCDIKPCPFGSNGSSQAANATADDNNPELWLPISRALHIASLYYISSNWIMSMLKALNVKQEHVIGESS